MNAPGFSDEEASHARLPAAKLLSSALPSAGGGYGKYLEQEQGPNTRKLDLDLEP